MQTCPGFHQPSYTINTRRFLPGVKRPGRDTDLSVEWFKNECFYTSTCDNCTLLPASTDILLTTSGLVFVPLETKETYKRSKHHKIATLCTFRRFPNSCMKCHVTLSSRSVTISWLKRDHEKSVYPRALPRSGGGGGSFPTAPVKPQARTCSLML
jgi:hypothetical protein